MIFILILLSSIQFIFGLQICDHGIKIRRKCPINFEKETNCTCQVVPMPKNHYPMAEYFHKNENWLKISCQGLNLMNIYSVTEKLSIGNQVIKYLNIRNGNLSVIEDDVLLDLKVAHLNIYDSSKYCKEMVHRWNVSNMLMGFLCLIP